MSADRFQRHRKAKKKLNEIFSNSEKVSAIHYSCESFYDRPDGSSPRITSIAIRELESGQTISFSIHQRAELRRLSVVKDDVEPYYNELEKEMLDELAAYLRANSARIWLHWNMRDEGYGFQAIEHRHRVLGGEPYTVQNDRKEDLSRLLINMYGVGYIGHPRLETLLDKNNIKARDFMTGRQEADAFKAKKYIDLHRSTLRKVDVLCNLAQRAQDQTLRTNSSWTKIYGISFDSLWEMIQKHPIYVVLSIVSTIAGAFGIASLF